MYMYIYIYHILDNYAVVYPDQYTCVRSVGISNGKMNVKQGVWVVVPMRMLIVMIMSHTCMYTLS